MMLIKLLGLKPTDFASTVIKGAKLHLFKNNKKFRPKESRNHYAKNEFVDLSKIIKKLGS